MTISCTVCVCARVRVCVCVKTMYIVQTHTHVHMYAKHTHTLQLCHIPEDHAVMVADQCVCPPPVVVYQTGLVAQTEQATPELT